MLNYSKPLGYYLIQLSLIVSLFVYLSLFGQWAIKTNLLSILPNANQSALLEQAERALYASNKHVMVAISGEQAIDAYHQLEINLPSLSNVSLSRVSIPTIYEISQFYKPFKNNVLSHSYSENLQDNKKITGLMLGQLTQINNVFVNNTLAFDPTLNLANFLSDELSNLIAVETYQDIPSVVYEQERYLLLTVVLNAEALSLKSSGAIVDSLLRSFDNITNAYSVDIVYSGIIFHTAQSSAQAEYEITTFGLLSLFGILLLIYIVFKSFYPILLALTVIAISSIYGLTAMMVFFDELHLLTLVFALTLIGIVIDYCFHVFVYSSSEGEGENKKLSLTRPLVLGFVTTSIGYLCLLSSPLDLLSQVAVFMIFGLLGALLSVLFLFPNTNLLKSIIPSAYSLSVIAYLKRIIQRMIPYRNIIYISAVSFTALSLLANPISFNDDIRLLNSSSEILLKNEAKMAQLLNYRNSQEIVVIANTWQDLLEKQESVIEQLKSNQTGLVIRSISELIPSIKKQHYNAQLLSEAKLRGVFDEGLTMLGMLNHQVDYTPLTSELFIDSPLKIISNQYMKSFDFGGSHSTNNDNIKRYTSRINISGVKLSADILVWLNSQKNVFLFDRAESITNVLSSYRSTIYYLIITAFVLVLVFLVFIYGFKNGLTSWSCICVSALMSLIASQYFLSYLNIFNLLGILLIFALAIDYIIFYQEHGLREKTLLAIMLSAISSIIVFGILILSVTPAVKSFGMTVMFGLVFITILAPLTSKNNVDKRHLTGKNQRDNNE